MPHQLQQLAVLFRQGFSFAAEGLVDAQHEVDEARHLVARRLGEVGAGEEGGQGLGVQKHGQRPTARALGQNLVGRLIDLVEVGTLLPIDLDVDEPIVHHLGGVGVLEGLVGHHVAPVTGGIADRQQDGLAALPRLAERLLVPRLPMHRVIRMLAQVRAGLRVQAIAHQPTLARSNAPLARIRAVKNAPPPLRGAGCQPKSNANLRPQGRRFAFHDLLMFN